MRLIVLATLLTLGGPVHAGKSSAKKTKTVPATSTTSTGTSSGSKGSFADFCWRDTYSRGAGSSPTWSLGSKSKTCASGEELDAGLCYPACKSGYSGVGPVCWGSAPTGWVECGMGAASSSTKCAVVVTDQVSSVFFLAKRVYTAFKAVRSATEITSTLTGMVAKLKSAYTTAKQGFKAFSAASAIGTWFSGDAGSAEDTVRTAAEVMSLIGLADPTGLVSSVSGIVSAYTYSKCSKISTAR